MSRKIVFPMLPLLLFAWMSPVRADDSLQKLAVAAVSPNKTKADKSIAALRAAGPAGLEALFSVHRQAVEQRLAATAPDTSEEWRRLATALDTVGGQRDCYASRLFWYTDFEQAKQAAKVGNKPILSLRLLGNLTDELSCANSRFFRTVLYANRDVSAHLRDHFILHWKSVRPVPKITIDYGDGRTVERTITGNSIHYILDANGAVIDGIPGLYGPQAFRRLLGKAVEVFQERVNPPTSAFLSLHRYHALRQQELMQAWASDLQTVGTKLPNEYMSRLSKLDSAQHSRKTPPTAIEAARVAITKSRMEIRPLRAMFSTTTLAAAADSSAWEKIAELHLADVKLDPGSLSLIRGKNPFVCEPTSGGGSASEQQVSQAVADFRYNIAFAQVVTEFQRNIALDTVRNEYLLHSVIHEWLSDQSTTYTIERLNERVYAELFLTPSSDPWLGLVEPNVYTAIENDGIRR